MGLNTSFIPKEAINKLLVFFNPKIRIADNVQDPLRNAFNLLGKNIGIKFKYPVATMQATVVDEKITRIVLLSNCRFRKVALADQWWKKDAGKLLAISKSDGSPLLLLPNNLGGYDMQNPVTLEKKQLTSSLAAGLEPHAFYFYRSLPDTIDGFKDIIKFSFYNLKKDLSLVFLTQVIIAGLMLLIPIATGFIFEKVIPNAESSILFQLVMILFTVSVAVIAFSIAQAISLMRISYKINISLQTAVWDRLFRLPVKFYRKFTIGDLANRASGIDEIQDIITSSMVITIIESVFVLFILILMFIYNVILALVSLFIILVYIAILYLFFRKQLKFARSLFYYQGKLSGLMLQLISNISSLRVANRENVAFLQWLDIFLKRSKMFFEYAKIKVNLAVITAAYAVLAVMLFFSFVIMQGDSLSFGVFMTFNAAFAALFASIYSLSSVLNNIIYIIPLYERIAPILTTNLESPSKSEETINLTGKISINHLAFRYQQDAPWVLEDINMRINPGEFVAIVGPSGVGKTTLLRLLLGFEQPSEGHISYNNRDLAYLNLFELRRQWGTVLQQATLLPGSILDNIRGNQSLSVDEILEILTWVGLDEDINAMPMGIHTIIAENARTISVGQRQRLLIARALAKNPKLLFLDEATNSLDNRNQAIIEHSLKRLNITRIIIAHRLSTIKSADNIYVLNDTKIVDSGSYAQLRSNKNSFFNQLVRRQLLK